MKIDPKPIHGKWVEGFSLDAQIVKSTYLGDDEYGHPRFDTVRSEVGELIYKLKYRDDRSVLPALSSAALEFLARWRPVITLVLPMPPSKWRRIQPVYELAKLVAAGLNVPCFTDCIRRIKELPELKNTPRDQKLELLRGAHAANAAKVSGQNILLLDDLFDSGATMNAVTESLYEAGAEQVFALTYTRTRG